MDEENTGSSYFVELPVFFCIGLMKSRSMLRIRSAACTILLFTVTASNKTV